MTDGLPAIICPVRGLAEATALQTALLGIAPTAQQPHHGLPQRAGS